MATMVNTATSSALEAPHVNPSAMPSYNGKTTEQMVNTSPKKKQKTKYRHVFATHSQSRQSCLTYGAPQSPSFVGFRNLMILVLGAPCATLPLRDMSNCRSILKS